MIGKIVKISSNDLYGNVDDRKVVIFATFTHVKYMNKYVIFSFKDEYDKKKLYYGSVHFKENSLVIFSVKEDIIIYIDNFLNQYLTGNIDRNEYEILNISNINKAELVSYNQKDFDKLIELENLSIVKEKKVEEHIHKNKKPIFLYIILVVLILFLIGLTYLYLNPEAFSVELKQLSCTKEEYNQKLEMNYTSTKEIKFNEQDNIKNIEVVDVYTFSDRDYYFEFKENNKQNEYFNLDGGYKYDDSNLELRLIYEERTIMNNYNEIFNYLKKEGYSCIEGKYYE